MALSYKIATIWGIPIKLHVSLLVIVFIFVNRFGLLMGLLLEVGFAASIVLHELGHSIVAIRKGCRVRQITLMFIGGAAQMERIPTKPLDEFLMAVAGPAVSVALGAACLTTGPHLPLPPVVGGYFNVVQLLGYINVGLAVFNLLPSFPMDGGRVLRAILARKMGRLRATFVAARLGKIMAIIFGLAGYFGVRGALAPGNWGLVAIAFFIYIAAGNEYRIVRMQEAQKRGAFDASYGFAGPSDQGADDGHVTIGPPPYSDGPNTNTDIRSSDEDTRSRGPFRV